MNITKDNDQPSTPEPSAIQTLRDLSSLLHLLHHRNSNQHRAALWYRHFSTLRRELKTLLLILSPPPHALSKRKSSHDKDSPEEKSRRDLALCLARWRRRNLVQRCHRAFSQLVAEASFAALGLVLMGVLGEVCAVLRLPFEDDGGSQDYHEQSGRVQKNSKGEEMQGSERNRNEEAGDGDGGVDLGVLVVRGGKEVEDAGGASERMSASVASQTSPTSPTGPTTSRTNRESRKEWKRQKGKRRNVIDELFSGL